MKDKLLQMRVDDEFLSELEYLKRINNFKSNSETVIKIIEKEFRKESINSTWIPTNISLPPIEKDVLIKFEDGGCCVGWICKDNYWRDRHSMAFDFDSVTEWVEIPK